MVPELEEAATEATITAVTPKVKKKSPPSRTATVEQRATARKNGPNNGSPQTGRKIHSEKERAQKLAQIAKAVGGGTALKSAVKQAGISEPTYYQWKKAAVPAAQINELTDLLALENENKRLKSLLAERLRKENTELKKKLGIR